MYQLVFLVTGMVIAGCCGQLTDFQVPVEADGSYSVVIGGQTWLKSAPTFFNKDGHRWATDSTEYQLVLQSTAYDSGPSGLVNKTTIVYRFGNSSDEVILTINVIPHAQNVVFTQHYVTGADSTSLSGHTSINATVGGFPCFQVTDGDEPLGFLSYGGYMVGDTDKTTGTFTNETNNINDGVNYGPLALFTETGRAIVISPADHYMASSMWHDGKPGGYISWGIMGGVNEIPANFTYTTVIDYADTINGAFAVWGERRQYESSMGMQRRRIAENDVTLRYVGYWTDYGAYYYYNAEPNKTFEETMLDVKEYAVDQDIPYGYMQLDSWWYPKDPITNGVYTWTPKESIFPNGLRELSARTEWKFSAHNRFWSSRTPYAKQNNGTYNWVVEYRSSIPDDLEFWRDLFREAASWGLITYEQDWLNRQTMYMEALQTDLTLGEKWLNQMGQAALENGLTIQYCMSMPRHALQSLHNPAVTQARVSDDFLFTRPDQWRIGVSSIFANAIGIMPFKDTFWTTSVQPGNSYNKSSEFPALEAAIASLSRGPVGPSDMIGGTNKTLLMRCCNADGLLMRPSRPALAIDKQLLKTAFAGNKDGGEIWTTTSIVNTDGVDREYGILFVAAVMEASTVTVGELMFDQLQTGVYFPYNNVEAWQFFNSSTVIDLTGCTKAEFCIFYFSPLLSGTGSQAGIQAIFGDISKWVPMSSDRVKALENVNDGKYLVATLEIPSTETVPIYYLADNEVRSTECRQWSKSVNSSCVISGHGSC